MRFRSLAFLMGVGVSFAEREGASDTARHTFGFLRIGIRVIGITHVARNAAIRFMKGHDLQKVAHQKVYRDRVNVRDGSNAIAQRAFDFFRVTNELLDASMTESMHARENLGQASLEIVLEKANRAFETGQDFVFQFAFFSLHTQSKITLEK